MADLTIIRNLCRERSITIRELAQRIGRDESSLQSAIRRGTTNTHTLELIARELGVSAGIFFEGYPRDGTKELRASPSQGNSQRKREAYRGAYGEQKELKKSICRHNVGTENS